MICANSACDRPSTHGKLFRVIFHLHRYISPLRAKTNTKMPQIYQFLPRDAMLVRYMLSLCVHLSIRLSVRLQTAQIIHSREHCTHTLTPIEVKCVVKLEGVNVKCALSYTISVQVVHSLTCTKPETSNLQTLAGLLPSLN